HPNVAAHIETVEDTLAEIDASDIPRVLVWNKMDLCELGTPEITDSDLYEAEVHISAKEHTGFDTLFNTISELLSAQLRPMKLLLPYDRGDIKSFLYEAARVVSEEYIAEGTVLEVELPKALYQRYKDYEYPEFGL
ncbi:MAG: hypothetical protein AAFQ07_11760, partial [Chloroflexota bacterium]